MVGLNRRLNASSLPECIVAAIILLVCFLITMEVLTRLVLAESEPAADVYVEIALRLECHTYGNGMYPPGKYIMYYDWGKIEVELKDYSVGARQLTLIAIPEKGTRSVKYDYLIEIRK